MEIKKEDAIAAYNAADENTRQVLLSLVPELKEAVEPKSITERVKTFEDACEILGEEHPFVCAYYCIEDVDECYNDIAAFLKLRIICAALTRVGNLSSQKRSGVGILGSHYGRKKNYQRRVTSGKPTDTSSQQATIQETMRASLVRVRLTPPLV